MALPNAPGVVKIVVKQSLAGVNVYNVLHASAGDTSGYVPTTLQNVANAVRSAWVTNVIPLQATALSLGTVEVIDLWSEFGGSAIATGTTAGTSGGTIAPASAAVCWSWAISRRYRGGHPRTYIGGLTAAGMSNQNTWLSTYVTSHTNAAAALRTAVNAVLGDDGVATFKLGALSYYKGKDPDTGKPALRPIPVFDEFLGVSVDTRIDSQRRRLGRDR